MASLGLDSGVACEAGQPLPYTSSEFDEGKSPATSRMETPLSSITQQSFYGRADTQLFKQLMTSKSVSRLADIPPQQISKPTPHPPTSLNKQNQMILDAATSYDRMITDWIPNGLAKLQSMQAVFNLRWDVGEQVQWVLTQYDQKSERLPHAEARSLSMSWVVEPTGECPDGEEGVREMLRTERASEGNVEINGRADDAISVGMSCQPAVGGYGRCLRAEN